jgi:alpha-D-ribose 1-methylphosphonate 5-triphosphate synthase subunit PhnG
MPDTAPHARPQTPDQIAQRQAWMRQLALADPQYLAQTLDALRAMAPRPLPTTAAIRPAEVGMSLVRARAGGSGERFNLGEMTLTRCALRLETTPQVVGFAHIQGRSRTHAENAALCDGLLQTPDWHDEVMAQVITPLADALTQRRAVVATAAAETRVDFFTLVRGE